MAPGAIVISPRNLARRARLRYTCDDCPGLRRVGAAPRFRYLNTQGRPLKDARQLARIRSLVIPPAWTEVWVCPHANGHLQATGRDVRGRKQYIYHPQWQEIAGRTKFIRLRPFGEALAGLRRFIGKHIREPKLTLPKVAAIAVRLLDETLVRIGNEEYARANDSYGLTTLRDKHARIRGPCLELHFNGKSGKDHQVELTDRRLARIVRQCQELPGQHLFQYRDEQGSLRPLGSSDVNRLIHAATGQPFTAKDFRTWKASALMLEYLRRNDEKALSQTEAKRVVSAALRQTARALNNTVTVCRKYYVHPQIIELFLAGRLAEVTGPIPTATKNRLDPYEQLLLRLLRRLERGQRHRS